tara:strand:- start:1741 stop:2037 length:297 start_codon:yes stop_codon:yes gene_type:complete
MDQPNHNTIEINDLKLIISEQKKIIQELSIKATKPWQEKVDDYIDKWYEDNSDDVDIGIVQLFKICGHSFDIDVMPDYLEKALYKKCIKIMLSLIKDL